MKLSDTNTPLHLLQPEYGFYYGIPSTEEINQKLKQILSYLDTVTPSSVVDSTNGGEIADFAQLSTKSVIKDGDFRLTSYEWGVTYIAMMRVYEVTEEIDFKNYTLTRLNFIKKFFSAFSLLENEHEGYKSPLHSVINPSALDDAGAICASMIIANHNKDYNHMIDNFIDFISKKQYRFSDGTLARNRPHPNTLWVDDMFMSIPALALMGRMTSNAYYYEDAVHQVKQFSDRLLDSTSGLYKHGWVEGMKFHPGFYWGRANGWAMLALLELLENLPQNHSAFDQILVLLQSHIQSVVKLQSIHGFWHQLLDRFDSYYETSATAIFTYCIARAINLKFLGAKEFGPSVILAWNAVSSKINDIGQVEGVCVGTGMGFDPAFYAFRPTSVYAAHGYGPVLMAGAEIIRLVKNQKMILNEKALQFE